MLAAVDATVDDVIETSSGGAISTTQLWPSSCCTPGIERKGQGRRAIAQTLAQRGIPRDVVDAALATLPDDDAERALEFARTKARSTVAARPRHRAAPADGSARTSRLRRLGRHERGTTALDASRRRRSAGPECSSRSDLHAGGAAPAAPHRRMAVIMTTPPQRTDDHRAVVAAACRADGSVRTYEVRTFGCQMNVHDSERLSGSLESAGYVRGRARRQRPTSSIINTCAVRDNAAGKLYGTLGHLASVKRRKDGMQIAVGGCLAQMDKQAVLDKAPWVDVVFGTHNMGSLPSLLERARHNGEAELEILESLEIFPSTLPTKRDSVYSGWVSISVGCNNTCTFCIVPSLRGKEKDRRPGDILNEIRLLVDDGAIEVTLLGQNVNSYGVEFGDRQAFGKLLRAAGEIEGLERIRFTSPHPAAFTDDVIDAMAETPAVMPQLHMPLQSGSDRILKAMRRSYRSERFLGILDRVRDAHPERRDHDRHHRRLPR